MKNIWIVNSDAIDENFASFFQTSTQNGDDFLFVMDDNSHKIPQSSNKYAKVASVSAADFNAKPSREAYVKGLEKLGVDAEYIQQNKLDVVVIGADEADIQAGNNLKNYFENKNPDSQIKTVLVGGKNIDEELEPNFQLENCSELHKRKNEILLPKEFQIQKILDSNIPDFYKHLAYFFEGETRVLCGEMYESPGIDHNMKPEHSADDLPSSILFNAGLLHDQNGVSLTPEDTDKYNWKNYSELNRGFVAGLAFRDIYKGGEEGYASFTKGQPEPVKLAREDFDKLHDEVRQYIDTPEKFLAVLYSTVSVYTSAFNDLGKSKELARLAANIEGKDILDHDEVAAILFEKRPDLFTGYRKHLNEAQRDFVKKVLNLNFNAPSCVQGETTIDHVRDFVRELRQIEDIEARLLTFHIAKIHAIADLAGTQGHKNPHSGATYNKFVHPSFDKVFSKLANAINGHISPDDTYFEILSEASQSMGLEHPQESDKALAQTRIGMMIRGRNTEDGELVKAAWDKLLGKRLDNRLVTKILEQELGTNNLSQATTSLWVQYAPDMLRIAAKENKSDIPPVEALEQSLTVLAQILTQARKDLGNNLTPKNDLMIQGYNLVPIIKKAFVDNDPDAQEQVREGIRLQKSEGLGTSARFNSLEEIADKGIV